MTQIKLRRDTSANFTSKNPVLGEGEPAYETDTKKLKIGDGTTAYTQLEYFSAGGGSSTDITATLPLKIVDGVILLEVDGQTIQIVDGKLTASSTAPTNMVTTDTAQTITGGKTFQRFITISNIGTGQIDKLRLAALDGSSTAVTLYNGLQIYTDIDTYASTLRVGDVNLPMILYGPTIKDNSGNKFLTSGNVTAGDNITITNTTNGISIAAAASSSAPPAQVLEQLDLNEIGTAGTYHYSGWSSLAPKHTPIPGISDTFFLEVISNNRTGPDNQTLQRLTYDYVSEQKGASYFRTGKLNYDSTWTSWVQITPAITS